MHEYAQINFLGGALFGDERVTDISHTATLSPAGVFQTLGVQAAEHTVIGVRHDGGKTAEWTIHQVCNPCLPYLLLLKLPQHLHRKKSVPSSEEDNKHKDNQESPV